MKKILILTALVLCTAGASATKVAKTTATSTAKVEIASSVRIGYNGYATGDGVRIRKSPSLNGKIIGKVNKGTILYAISYSNGWYKVRWKGGIGYINARYFECAA